MFGQRSWNWGAFVEAVADLAANLAGRGIGQGDRVAIVAHNSDSRVLLLGALARLRAMIVPVNPKFGEGELAYVLGHADPKMVMVGPDVVATVRTALAQAGCSPAIISAGARGDDGVPSLLDLTAGEPVGA